MAQPFRLAQISDMHLDPNESVSLERFDLLRARLHADPPDLIIATGDLSDHGAQRPADLTFARDQLADLPAPVLSIPGNHDVGNKRGVGKGEVTAAKVQAWCDVMGDDRFVTRRDGWRLIGIDSLIIGSGLEREQAQWDWIDRQLDEADAAGELLAWFMHEPPYLFEPEEVFGDKSDYWAVRPDVRPALLARLRRPCVRLIANSHVHWHRISTLSGATWVWSPAACFVVQDHRFPPGGDVVGFMRYTFNGEGVTPEMVPLDLPKNTIVFNPGPAEHEV